MIAKLRLIEAPAYKLHRAAPGAEDTPPFQGWMSLPNVSNPTHNVHHNQPCIFVRMPGIHPGMFLMMYSLV